MLYLGVQFEKITGPDATCNYKLILNVDESQRKALKELMIYKKNTPFLLSLADISSLDNPSSIVTEDEKAARTRLMKKLHALMKNIGDEHGVEMKDIKDRLREKLQEQGLISESTKELDIKGLSAAIYYLKNEFEL